MFQRLHWKRPLAFLDVESTSCNLVTESVVEIAVLCFTPNAKPVSIPRRANPGVPIPLSPTAIHSIKDADVADCPPFGHITRNLVRVLDGSALAGFGSKKFNLPLLAAQFSRSRVHFPLTSHAIIQVRQIYRLREKPDLRAGFAFYYGKSHEQVHRGDPDLRETGHILDAQLQRYRNLLGTVRELHCKLTEVDRATLFRLEDDLGHLERMLTENFLDVKDLIRPLSGRRLMKRKRTQGPTRGQRPRKQMVSLLYRRPHRSLRTTRCWAAYPEARSTA